MKSIGIVVCNFNKADYVVNCVKSLFEQTIEDFDIYVVDNGSSDHSVQALRENFGNRISILENKENLGGSGGFNTGLREVLKKDYKYFMCVDNDVVFDKKAVEALKEYLDAHEEVGMVGSKIYYMDDPERIWSYGGEINEALCKQKDNYRNAMDSPDIPESMFCTWVPACSLMVRKSVVEEVGIMPEENFIYYDDIEWGYKVSSSGKKVAVIATSKVWHKVTGPNAVTTFHNYYTWRNRIKFYLKYFGDKENKINILLNDMFQLVYSCHLKGEDNIVKSVMYAFDDAVHGNFGKAADYKILPRTHGTLRVASALGEANTLLIKYNGHKEGIENILKSVKENKPGIEISIAVIDDLEECKRLQMQHRDINVVRVYEPEDYDAHMVMCEHIFRLQENVPEDCYIDPWCNIIFTKEDFIYAKSFAQTKELFLLCKKELLMKM